MNNLTVCDFFMQHALLILLLYILCYSILATAVHSLPAPTENSSQSYVFWFTFLNAMFRNVAALRALTRMVVLETSKNLKAVGDAELKAGIKL